MVIPLQYLSRIHISKLAQLTGCGVQTVFALFPDAAALMASS